MTCHNNETAQIIIMENSMKDGEKILSDVIAVMAGGHPGFQRQLKAWPEWIYELPGGPGKWPGCDSSIGDMMEWNDAARKFLGDWHFGAGLAIDRLGFHSMCFFPPSITCKRKIAVDIYGHVCPYAIRPVLALYTRTYPLNATKASRKMDHLLTAEGKARVDEAAWIRDCALAISVLPLILDRHDSDESFTGFISNGLREILGSFEATRKGVVSSAIDAPVFVSGPDAVEFVAGK